MDGLIGCSRTISRTLHRLVQHPSRRRRTSARCKVSSHRPMALRTPGSGRKRMARVQSTLHSTTRTSTSTASNMALSSCSRNMASTSRKDSQSATSSSKSQGSAVFDLRWAVSRLSSATCNVEGLRIGATEVMYQWSNSDPRTTSTRIRRRSGPQLQLPRHRLSSQPPPMRSRSRNGRCYSRCNCCRTQQSA